MNSMTLNPPQVVADNEWPAQVELIISALETGKFQSRDRRGVNRHRYRVQASLRLFCDSEQTPARQIFTRDLGNRGLGFVSSQRLPLGYGGLVDVPMPDGQSRSVHCTLLRCRQAAPGWFEGALSFTREQPDLEEAAVAVAEAPAQED